MTTARRPTIRQIAEETGLSVTAVSYALRGERVEHSMRPACRLARQFASECEGSASR